MGSLYQRQTECVGTQLECTVPLKSNTLWMCSTQQQPLLSAGTDPAVQQPMSVRGMLTICAVTGPAHQQQQPLLSARTNPANVSERHAYNLRCHGPSTPTAAAIAQCLHQPSQCQWEACLQSALSRAQHTNSSSHCSVLAPTQPMSVRGMLTICAVTGPKH